MPRAGPLVARPACATVKWTVEERGSSGRSLFQPAEPPRCRRAARRRRRAPRRSCLASLLWQRLAWVHWRWLGGGRSGRQRYRAQQLEERRQLAVPGATAGVGSVRRRHECGRCAAREVTAERLERFGELPFTQPSCARLDGTEELKEDELSLGGVGLPCVHREPLRMPQHPSPATRGSLLSERPRQVLCATCDVVGRPEPCALRPLRRHAAAVPCRHGYRACRRRGRRRRPRGNAHLGWRSRVSSVPRLSPSSGQSSHGRRWRRCRQGREDGGGEIAGINHLLRRHAWLRTGVRCE